MFVITNKVAYLCTGLLTAFYFYIVNHHLAIMAKPIKETPVLRGKEAQRFAKRIDNPRAVDAMEVYAAREAYNSVMAIAKFQF